jgi:hypothetical protein
MSVELGMKIIGAGLAFAGINVALAHSDPITGGTMFAIGAAVFLWALRRQAKR